MTGGYAVYIVFFGDGVHSALQIMKISQNTIFSWNLTVSRYANCLWLDSSGCLKMSVALKTFVVWTSCFLVCYGSMQQLCTVVHQFETMVRKLVTRFMDATLFPYF